MTDISVFTLNCWGIGMGVSRDRVVRMRAIGQHLASSSYDIVCLQEVWCPEDFITICDLTRDVLPYNHFFDHGIIGSGTCVLSKAQILDSAFHEFSQNGYPHKILHGDWFAGKGIGICNIDYKVFMYMCTFMRRTPFTETNLFGQIVCTEVKFHSEPILKQSYF